MKRKTYHPKDRCSRLSEFPKVLYIKLESTSSSSPSRSATTKTGIVNVSTTLNVRSGPGTNYKRIGYLTKNQKVTLLTWSGSWYQIKFGNTTGYVSSDYIKIQK